MRRIVLAIAAGALGAVAWAWWGKAVSVSAPTQAAVADFALIAFSAINVNYIAQRRYKEFVAYALSAAVGTWLVVFLSK